MLVAQAVISAVKSRIMPYNLFIIATYQSTNLMTLPAFGEYRQEKTLLMEF
jgi:hypothetical protein